MSRPTIERPPAEPLEAACARFIALRTAAGLSVAEVARRMKTSRSEVTKFECGRRRPQRHHFELLEQAIANGRSR